MKKFITLSIFLLTMNLSFGQSFTLKDSIFKRGDTFISYDIMFDLNKPEITPVSFLYLDSLVIFMIHNKKLALEIGVHCDERWSEIHSTCLTCKRAEKIAAYLIAKGINPNRLVATGYNDKKPIIVRAKTEEEHQKNRRTEFTILRTDYVEY